MDHRRKDRYAEEKKIIRASCVRALKFSVVPIMVIALLLFWMIRF